MGEIDIAQKELLKAERSEFVSPTMVAGYLAANFQFISIREYRNELWRYDEDGTWHSDGNEFVRAFLEYNFPKQYRAEHLNETILHLTNKTFASVKDFALGSVRYNPEDKEDILICVKNGVYSTKRKELLPHNPDYFFKRAIPHNYNPQATCPEIHHFIWSITTPYWDRFFSLYEQTAWLLEPENRKQKLGLWWGRGSNGKGKCLELNKRFIGVDNTSSVPLTSLQNNRFAAAELYDKMLNEAGEIPQDKPLSDTGILKGLRGEDTLTAEKKGRDPFQFVAQTKSIWAANKFPKTEDDTDAFMRSWIITKFENQFLDELGNKDANLMDKIATEAELEGLLAFILKYILPFVVKRPNFTFDQTLAENRELYTRKSNSAKIFIDCRLVFEREAQVSKADVRQAYLKYCEAEDLLVETEKAFRQTLNASGLQFEEHKVKGVPTWVGIRLSAEEDQDTKQKELGENSAKEKIPADFEAAWAFYLKKQGIEDSRTFPTFPTFSYKPAKEREGVKEGIGEKDGNLSNPSTELPKEAGKGTCELCAAEASPIFDYKGRYYCRDCLNNELRQDAGEVV